MSLPENDVNLDAPSPLTTQCIDPNAAVGNSHFINLPFRIDDYIKATDTTCPPPGVFAANGVLNGSGLPRRMHRGSRASLLSGAVPDRSRDAWTSSSHGSHARSGSRWATTTRPSCRSGNTCTRPARPDDVIADNFFQGGFGGSFLNHQVLVAAQVPIFANADKSGVTTGCSTGTVNCDLHSVVDSNGFPNTYPLYKPTGTVNDGALTEAAGASGQCTPAIPPARPRRHPRCVVTMR